MTSKPPNTRQMLAVGLDVIEAARATNRYPRIVDRGAELSAVMAVVAALVRVAAERSDAGAELALTTAGEAITEGRRVGDVTTMEATASRAVLWLADPRRDLRETWDRAEGLSRNRSFLDVLDVIAAGVDLLQLLTTPPMTGDPDAALDAIAVELMALLEGLEPADQAVSGTKGDNDNGY